MNVRKMMARLNAATASYDMARGGIPELTPQDIAAALGMIHDKTARDIFTAIWWPDGAELTRKELLDQMRGLLMTEFSRRCREAQIAKLDLHIAECNWAATNHHPEHDRQLISKLRHRAEETAANSWPGRMDVYPRICAAILIEIASPWTCKACSGTGMLIKKNDEKHNRETKVIGTVCNICNGRGTEPLNDCRRADMLGRDESSYRARWKKVYEWIYEIAASAESYGARELAKLLNRECSEISGVTPPNEMDKVA